MMRKMKTFWRSSVLLFGRASFEGFPPLTQKLLANFVTLGATELCFMELIIIVKFLI
jgi:hypothetical protein